MELCASVKFPGVVIISLYLTLDNNGKQPITNTPIITGLPSEKIWFYTALKTSDKDSSFSFLTIARKTICTLKKVKGHDLCPWWGIWENIERREKSVGN